MLLTTERSLWSTLPQSRGMHNSITPMKTSRLIRLALIGTAGMFVAAGFAAVSVEDKVVGAVLEPDSTRQFNPYSVSPRGGRLATVVRKGSKMTVTIDGVEGPRFDAIIPPTFSYIDPRSAAAVQNMAATMTPAMPMMAGGIGSVMSATMTVAKSAK